MRDRRHRTPHPETANAPGAPDATRLSRRRYSGRLFGFGIPALVIGGLVASFAFGRPEVVLLGAIAVGAYVLLLAMPTMLADSSVDRGRSPRGRR